MARTSTGIGIEASVNDKASKPMHDIADAIGGTDASLLKLDAAVNLVEKAWGLLSRGAGALVSAIAGAVEKSEEAARASRDLATAINIHGGNAATAVPKLQAFAAAIQRQTGIGDDATLALQAHMAALGVMPENLEAATVAAIGWSEATGKNMTAASTDVAKALNGNFLQLQKFGIQVKTSEEAIAAMSKGFALAVAEGGSLSGRLHLLSEDWGDLQEILGSTVSESDNAKATVTSLSQAVLQLQNVFASEKGRAAVNDFFQLIAAGVGALIDATLGAMKLWEDVGSRLQPKGSLAEQARRWFGAKKIKEEGAKVEDDLREVADRLADTLRVIGAGKAPKIELPPIETAPLKKQLGEASKAAQAFEKDVDAALKRAQAAQERFDKAREKAAEERRRTEIAAETSILALQEQIQTKLAEIKEANDQRSAAVTDSWRRRQQEAAEEWATVFAAGGERVIDSAIGAFSRVGDVVNGSVVTVGAAFGEFLKDIGAQIAAFMGRRLIMFFLQLIGTAVGSALGPVGAGLAFLLGVDKKAKGGAVQGFAGGGEVTGGIPGQDSVLILAQRGEWVLPVDTVDAIKRGRGAPGPGGLPMFASGGLVAGGGGLTLQVIHQSLAPLDRSSWAQLVERQIAPELQDMMRSGRFAWGG